MYRCMCNFNFYYVCHLLAVMFSFLSLLFSWPNQNTFFSNLVAAQTTNIHVTHGAFYNGDTRCSSKRFSWAFIEQLLLNKFTTFM